MVISVTAFNAARWDLLEQAKKPDHSDKENDFFESSLRQQALLFSKRTGKGTVLYKLKKDEKTVGFLFPTCHLVTPNGKKLPKKTLNKLKKSGMLHLEMDVSNPITVVQFQQACLQLQTNKETRKQIQKLTPNYNKTARNIQKMQRENPVPLI